jgi:hypothetical protein
LSKPESKTTDQQTKEEYVAECVAGGKTKEECETAWNEAHKTDSDDPKAKSHAQLVAENEMLTVKLGHANKLLVEAARLFKEQEDDRDSKLEAQKYDISTQIERSTKGKLKTKDLMRENFEVLAKMRTAIDSIEDSSFVNISALLDESEKKRKPQLSVGEWDPIAKKYRGGI